MDYKYSVEIGDIHLGRSSYNDKHVMKYTTRKFNYGIYMYWVVNKAPLYTLFRLTQEQYSYLYRTQQLSANQLKPRNDAVL